RRSGGKPGKGDNVRGPPRVRGLHRAGGEGHDRADRFRWTAGGNDGSRRPVPDAARADRATRHRHARDESSRRNLPPADRPRRGWCPRRPSPAPVAAVSVGRPGVAPNRVDPQRAAGVLISELTSETAEWDAFVRASDDGSPFHLTAWRRAVEETFGFRSHFL